jgi:hypothetical protein
VFNNSMTSRIMPWISLLIGLIVTLFILTVILIHTDFFAANTSRLLSRFMFGGTNFSLSIDKIGGNTISNIEAEGVVIRYRGDQFSFDLLRIDRVRLDYNLLSVFKDNPTIHELVLERPHVWLKPDSTGRRILPWSGGGGENGNFPNLKVERLTVEGGQFIIQGEDRAEVVNDISVTCSINSNPSEISMDILGAGAKSESKDAVLKDLLGRVNLIRGSHRQNQKMEESGYEILLSKLLVQLRQSKLEVDGRIETDPWNVGISMNATPANIKELSEISGIGESHYGEIEGMFVLKGKTDSLYIDGVCNGVFSGYAMENIRARMCVDRSGIKVIEAKGRLNGTMIKGSASYVLDDPETFKAHLEVREMDLSQGVVPGVELPWTDFNGGLKLTYIPEREDLNFSFELENGHIKGFPFDSGIFTARYSDEDLSIERLLLSGGSHWIDSHGHITGGDSLKLFFELRCEKDDTLFSYFDIEEYRARLDLNCILQGTLDSWNLRSSGSCEELAYNWAFVDSGGIKLVIDRGDSYRVLFDLDADSCDVGSYGFSGINLSLDYFDDITEIKKLYLVREGLKINTIANVNSRGDSNRIDFSELTMEAFQEKWIGGGDLSIVTSDSVIELRDLQLHSREGAVYLDTKLKRVEGMVDGVLKVKRFNISLLNGLDLLPSPIKGEGRGIFRFDGRMENPRLRGDFEIVEGSYDTIQVDSLSSRWEWDDELVKLDTLIIETPEGYANGCGEIWGVSPKEFYNRSSAILDSSVSRLELECEKMTISPLLNLIGYSRLSGGYFSGAISVSDSTIHPRIILNGLVKDMVVSSVSIPSVELDLRTSGDFINVGGVVHISPNSTGTLKGYVPLKRKPYFYDVDEERDFSIEFKIPDSDFGKVSQLTRTIAESSGRFSIAVDIAGKLKKPRIGGEFILDDASFRLFGMGERFHNVNSRITLGDSVIRIERMEGKEGKEGEFECRGEIILSGWKPEKYHLRANLDNIPVTSFPDIMAVVSGELMVGNDTLQGGNTVPVIMGELEVNRGEIYYDLNDFSSEQASVTMAPPSWIAAIDLDIPGDVWLKTPDAKIELQGKVTVHHNQKGNYLRGRLSLLRGWYNIYNNKFHIESGELDFVHARGFRPVVDILAETRDPQGKKIYLRLVWTQDDIEPRLSLSHEDPGYSETDIWKMLGGGVVASSEEGTTSWDAVSTAQNLAANYIESVLNSQMEGVTIELESRGTEAAGGGLEEEETMIAIGKYLSEGLYVKYKQGLYISSAKEITVEYRISDLFLIRSQIIRYSEKALKSESHRAGDEVNVDIKLRWEF